MAAFPLQAIFIFNGLFVLGCSLVLGWLFRKRRDTSVHYWIASGLLSSSVTTLMAFGHYLPPLWGYLVPNVLQVMSVCMLGFSFFTLCNVRVPAKWLVNSVCLSLLYGALLMALTKDGYSIWTVPYVSGVNGLLTLAVACFVGYQRRRSPALRYLAFPQSVLSVMAGLWLIRIPLALAGLVDLAFDESLGNWLVFTALLSMNIVLQFSFLGVRLADSLDKHSLLLQLNLRLEALISQHHELTRQMNSSLAAMPDLPAQTLSAQMAHEINQPLATMRLKLESLMKWAVTRHDRGEDDARVKAMIIDIDRISATVRGLENLVGTDSLELDLVSLRSVVTEAFGTLEQVTVQARQPELSVKVNAPLFSKTLNTLARWLQTYGTTPAPEGLAISPCRALNVQCAASADGRWAEMRLKSPGVHLADDVRQLLSSGTVLGPLGASMPLNDAHELLDMLVAQHAMRSQRGRVTLEESSATSGTTLLLQLPLHAPMIAVAQ